MSSGSASALCTSRVQLQHERARRLRRRDEADPRRRIEAFQAELVERRHVRQRVFALRARDRERFQLSRFDLRQSDRDIRERHLDFAGQDRGHRRPAALVRHVDEIDACHALEELADEMRGAAFAEGREVELAAAAPWRAGSAPAPKRGHRRIHDQHVGAGDERADGREVALQIERELAVERRVARDRRGDDEERVAVGVRFRGDLRADVAARAAAVVDDDRAAPERVELVRDEPRRDVVQTAGRERDDEADGAVGEVGVTLRRRPKEKSKNAKDAKDAKEFRSIHFALYFASFAVPLRPLRDASMRGPPAGSGIL